MKMEERARLLKELGRVDIRKDIQNAMDDVTRERRMSRIQEDVNVSELNCCWILKM